MSNALISDHIRVYLKDSQTRLSMLLGGAIDGEPATPGSALQNPDMSRHVLDCLLRRTERQVERTNGWTAFFASTPGSCANSNGADL